MAFTAAGAEFMALRMGSDVPGLFVQAIAIGSGSGTAAITDKILLAERVRSLITGSPDFSTSQIVEFQGDFNTVQMSGTIFTEFGLFTGSELSTGSLWQRESVAPITFDGTNELQITSAIRVIPEP